jgi:hypothetical protein
VRFIATMAHELAHYVLATLKSGVPGGRELAELATDLAVAYLGFGVFSANTAFEFSQHQDTFSQGWSSSRNGYLSERSWAFAIALFCALTDAPLPLGHLKKSAGDLTKAAARYLSKNDALLAPLRAIA